MKLLWGDLHNHCGISYGVGSLENALENAAAHLDFCGITGHAMWPDMYERNEDTAFIVDFHRKGFQKLLDGWSEVQRTVNSYNSADLVTFQTYEMHSSLYGDHHFVSPDPHFPLIYRDSPAEIIRDCGCRAIAVPHHIGYTPGYRGTNWEHFHPAISPVIEVCSKHGCAMRDHSVFPYYHDMGPLDPAHTVTEGLRQGKRFSFVGSTDHHAGFPGSYGDGLAAVWAQDKSREAIWDALLKGHTYAVTGDRIACRFSLNDAMMGDTLAAGRRQLLFAAEGDAPVEWMTIRKNGKVLAAAHSDDTFRFSPSSRYKLRIEMGWSQSPDRFRWEGSLRIDGGEIIRVQPYLRGLNVLSPHDKENGGAEVNMPVHRCSFRSEQADFITETVRNQSTLHPQTNAFLFEFHAAPGAAITICINGQQRTLRLEELLSCGYSAHVKPWHSHAYKVHTALCAEACEARVELADLPSQEEDCYWAEAVQSNGCRAFVSPIWVRS